MSDIALHCRQIKSDRMQRASVISGGSNRDEGVRLGALLMFPSLGLGCWLAPVSIHFEGRRCRNTKMSNDVVLYRQEGLRGFCYECVRLAGHIVRVLLRAKDHRWLRINKIIGGTVAGLKFHPQIEYVE